MKLLKEICNIRTMKKYIVLLLIAAGFSSCNTKQDKSDAYGNFEANEVMVSAQSTGQLVQLTVKEGELLKKNQQVGLVDTMSVSLQIEQLNAKKAAVLSNLSTIASQAAVSDEQMKSLDTEKKRLEKLLSDGAATSQQMDEIDGKVSVLKKQVESVKTQMQVVRKEADALDKQVDLLKLQLEKCRIINPIDGTVLTQFSEQDEVVAMGKPIYKIASLGEMILRVYVDAEQLSGIEIGQEARVLVDNSTGEMDVYRGVVSWISEQAEFTPKIIQTREERVSLVYAIKLTVKNDGKLKIGMPAEVLFSNAEVND